MIDFDRRRVHVRDKPRYLLSEPWVGYRLVTESDTSVLPSS